ALINGKSPMPLHDNARLHVAAVILQKLNELGYETLPHPPPYSSDLFPTDFHISQRINCLKTKLTRQSFLSKFHLLQRSKVSYCWDKQACNLPNKLC
ncbi:Histone-lysine N-methyltransferase SETMAR, partial [Melipona quadrifasciata]